MYGSAAAKAAAKVENVLPGKGENIKGSQTDGRRTHTKTMADGHTSADYAGDLQHNLHQKPDYTTKTAPWTSCGRSFYPLYLQINSISNAGNTF